jgi:hypothetical protein
MIAFAIGKTYKTRSICDSNCWFSVTVASRTAKTVKTEKGKTLRIGSYDGAEFVRPHGSYSMAPIIRAG